MTSVKRFYSDIKVKNPVGIAMDSQSLPRDEQFLDDKLKQYHTTGLHLRVFKRHIQTKLTDLSLLPKNEVNAQLIVGYRDMLALLDDFS